MARYLFGIPFALGLLCIGVYCLLRPHRMRQYMVDNYSQGMSILRWRALSIYMRAIPNNFIIQLVGVFFIGASVLIIYKLLTTQMPP